MPGTQEREVHTESTSKVHWEPSIYSQSCVEQVIVGGGQAVVRPPDRESLERRFEASDKSWTAEWLEDETDPCAPE